MATKFQRAARLIEAAARLAKTREGRNRVEEINLNGVGYAEPGYGSAEGEDVIAFGDWNTCSRYDREAGRSVDTDGVMPRLSEALERIGVEIEWSDEWCDCSDCGKAVRTSGDSYSWTPSFKADDGGLLCVECI